MAKEIMASVLISIVIMAIVIMAMYLWQKYHDKCYWAINLFTTFKIGYSNHFFPHNMPDINHNTRYTEPKIVGRFFHIIIFLGYKFYVVSWKQKKLKKISFEMLNIFFEIVFCGTFFKSKKSEVFDRKQTDLHCLGGFMAKWKCMKVIIF